MTVEGTSTIGVGPDAAAKYVAGETFQCTKRWFDPSTGEAGDPCGTEILMHGYHWCAQVCPKCLANYFVSPATGQELKLDHGFYPADLERQVRENIARNGGQYVPMFER